MERTLFYRAGTTEACTEAEKFLRQAGISFTDCRCPEATDILLDVPSFSAPGILRSGEPLQKLLEDFPQGPILWGGRLTEGKKNRDLLEDPGYLAENAAITADCALRLASPSLKTTWRDSQVLVIGWGRIGKSLCRMLKALGAQVTVCARSAPDRALLSAFGYQVQTPEEVTGQGFQVIFNTAPATHLEDESLADCPIPMDLASTKGLPGKHVIHARGLPGIHAPITSGKLIAQTILKQSGR